VTGGHGPRELDAFLASIPFFASLDEPTRLQLAEQLERVHVAAGQVVIAQDDAGDGLFLLPSGRKLLGSAPIEDLPRRFFCVSANLTRAEEVVHERGVLWRAVRASLSLPGIFPPVYADGDLLVDGAALDNVPVEAMRARIGSGTVVAVDLDPKVEPMTAAPFGPGLSGWRVLGHRLNPLAPPRPMPSLMDILSRSTALSGVRDWRAAQVGHHVDLLLHPPVPPSALWTSRPGPG
jgi:predicted acylesterase/phospholipase RssA